MDEGLHYQQLGKFAVLFQKPEQALVDFNGAISPGVSRSDFTSPTGSMLESGFQRRPRRRVSEPVPAPDSGCKPAFDCTVAALPARGAVVCNRKRE